MTDAERTRATRGDRAGRRHRLHLGRSEFERAHTVEIPAGKYSSITVIFGRFASTFTTTGMKLVFETFAVPTLGNPSEP